MEVARWRFLTYLNGALALLQVVVLLTDGFGVLRALLAVLFAGSSAYNRVLWARALNKVDERR